MPFTALVYINAEAFVFAFILLSMFFLLFYSWSQFQHCVYNLLHSGYVFPPTMEYVHYSKPGEPVTSTAFLPLIFPLILTDNDVLSSTPSLATLGTT